LDLAEQEDVDFYASELHRRLPGSVVCDPEHLGFGLHQMLPPALRADFQDLAAWRSGTHEIPDLVAHGHEGPVIIPMTLVNPRYFARSSAGSAMMGTTCATSRC
jgi:hypothetical protein